MIRQSMTRRFALLSAALLLLAALAVVGLAACGSSSSASTTPSASASPGAATSAPSRSSSGTPNFNQLIVATTTSLNDSGLNDVVVPAYHAEHPNIDVKIIAVGSGAAIAMAEAGNADVLLVHSPAAELAFMDGGFGTLRLPFAYNYFTIVGPKSDPAKVASATTAAQAFKQIAAYGKTLPAGKVAFVSRGDASGTNTKELQLWGLGGVTPTSSPSPASGGSPAPLPEPSGSWYIKTGQGMAATLQVANQKDAYTLTDTATFLANKSTLSLVPLLEKSADLKNLYDVILINQAKFPVVNSAGAEFLASWLVGPEGQRAIAAYGKSTYGQALFFPNSAAVPVTPQK
jgi:tungstate transport system substrate-binding protein